MDEDVFSEVKEFIRKHWKVIAIIILLFSLMLSLAVYLRKKKGKEKNNEG